MNDSLYVRVGGESAIRKVAQVLYDKIYTDETLQHFFCGVDRMAMSNKMQGFMRIALGPDSQSETAPNLRTAHRRSVGQGLNDEHFDCVAGHILETLRELNVDESIIDEILALVDTTRSDVLNR